MPARKPRFVCLQLGDAAVHDGGERRGDAALRIERGRRRLDRARRQSARKRVAALGFARVAKAQRHALGQFQRQLEQTHRAAGEKFDLGLADLACPPAAADLAAVQAQFGQAAVGETQAQAGTRELGRECGRERRAQPRRAKHLRFRRRGEQAEVERLARQRPFPFLAQVQPGRGLAFGLEGLQPAPAVRAQAQRQPRAQQGPLGRVVIDAVNAARRRAPLLQSLDAGIAAQPAQVLRRQQQLQLCFHYLRLAVSTPCTSLTCASVRCNCSRPEISTVKDI